MKTSEYNKHKQNTMAITRDIREFDKDTDNIYESIVIMSKRANQIGTEIKEEFQERMQEFANTNTNTEIYDDTIENRELIELARFYEHLPKPTLLATEEFRSDDVHYQYPSKK